MSRLVSIFFEGDQEVGEGSVGLWIDLHLASWLPREANGHFVRTKQH